MSVYRDELWAYRMCTQITELYPHSPILICPDGPGHFEKFKFDNLYIVPFEQRRKHELGGMYTQRIVLAASVAAKQYDIDVMIKVDPDSYLYRRFTNFPDSPWFGSRFSTTKVALGTYDCLQGGCWGIRAEPLVKLAESNILLSDVLLDKEITYPRYSARVFSKPGDKGRDREFITNDDLVMGWGMTQLGYYPTDWDEVYLQQNGEEYQDSPPYRFAVTHPVRCVP